MTNPGDYIFDGISRALFQEYEADEVGIEIAFLGWGIRLFQTRQHFKSFADVGRILQEGEISRRTKLEGEEEIKTVAVSCILRSGDQGATGRVGRKSQNGGDPGPKCGPFRVRFAATIKSRHILGKGFDGIPLVIGRHGKGRINCIGRHRRGARNSTTATATAVAPTPTAVFITDTIDGAIISN
jgi:hypothetical protein